METLMKAFIFVTLPAALVIASPAAGAQLGSYNDPAPGASSLMHSDPARAINLGIALAKTGRKDEAAQQFRSVLMQDDVEMIVADGQTIASHVLAERALASLQNGVLSH